MAAEVAQAFVRIRPNMAGFRAEAETGVRSAFSRLAAVAGLALGAGAAFEFGKHVIGDAANLQKQIETINAEFGAAGRSVSRFGEGAAHSLGISANLADATSARFGILFRNIGVGKEQAAVMTINLEKLAGSLSAIRGVDPAEVLNRLPLALAGNTRSLKQLGLSIDSTQIKLAALKLGLISNIHQAITPGVKAQAIYALATANLGTYMQQAKAHAGDLANVQRRLSAEWKNARDMLGRALLPTFSALARQLEGWLTRMQRSGKLQRDFNEVARTTKIVLGLVVGGIRDGVKVWNAFSDAVGGTKRAVELLFAVLAVNRMRRIASGIFNNLVTNGFQQVGASTAEARAAAVKNMGIMGVASRGLGLTIRSAIVTTGIGAITVAIGLATTYIISHWSQVKHYTVALAMGIAATWDGLKQVLIGTAEIIGGAMATALTMPFRAFMAGVGVVNDVLNAVGIHVFDGVINQANSMLDSFTTNLTARGMQNVVEGGAKMADGFTKAWDDATRKSAEDSSGKKRRHRTGQQLGQAIGDGAASTAASGAKKVAKAVDSAMQAALQAAHQRIVDSVIAAKTNLDNIGQALAATIDKILAKLGQTGGALAGSPQAAAFKKLKDMILGGAPDADVSRASQQLSSQLQGVGKTGATDAVKQRIADLTSEFNKGQITLSQFNARVARLLRENGITYAAAGRAGGRAFADQFRAQLRGLRDQAGAIAALPPGLRRAGAGGGGEVIRIIRPLEVMRTENARIASRAERQRERAIKANERAAKAAEKSAALAQAEANTHVGQLPGGRGGRRSRNANNLAAAGVQP